eukprot:PhF_6_TR16258/c0_g1_i1/m.25175
MKRSNIRFVLTVCMSVPLAFIVFCAIDMNSRAAVKSDDVPAVVVNSNPKREDQIFQLQINGTAMIPTATENKFSDPTTPWYDEWNPAALRKSSQRKIVFPVFAGVLLKSRCKQSTQEQNSTPLCARRPMWDNTDAPL